MWPNPQFPADLITFTGEILNGKIRFLFNEDYSDYQKSSFLNVINAMHRHTIAFAKLIVLFYRENTVLGLMSSANPQFFAPNLQILQSFVLKLYYNCVIIVLVIKKEKWITCHMYLTATQMNVDLHFLFTIILGFPFLLFSFFRFPNSLSFSEFHYSNYLKYHFLGPYFFVYCVLCRYHWRRKFYQVRKKHKYET